jgi:hypothetical protein
MRPDNSGSIRLLGNNRLLISREGQKNMPLNEEVLVVISAEFGARLQYQLVYSITFKTRLALRLRSSKTVVPLGADVYLSTASS